MEDNETAAITPSLVEYKIPVRELRKLAETHVYSNLDCNEVPNPDGAVRMLAELTHTAPQLQIDKDDTVSMPCAKGYCSSKASHGVERDAWYFEVRILRGWTRVGWGQALAEIQGPVGYDEFGYGFSNRHYATFHCSQLDTAVDVADDEAAAIRVIGCLIRLPAADTEPILADDETRVAIERQHPPLNFNTTYRIRQQMLQQGSVEFFVDGQPAATSFQHIYLGKYFPMVSVFKDAAVQVRFREEDFVYPIPEGARAMSLAK